MRNWAISLFIQYLHFTDMKTESQILISRWKTWTITKFLNKITNSNFFEFLFVLRYIEIWKEKKLKVSPLFQQPAKNCYRRASLRERCVGKIYQFNGVNNIGSILRFSTSRKLTEIEMWKVIRSLYRWTDLPSVFLF